MVTRFSRKQFMILEQKQLYTVSIQSNLYVVQLLLFRCIHICEYMYHSYGNRIFPMLINGKNWSLLKTFFSIIDYVWFLVQYY